MKRLLNSKILTAGIVLLILAVMFIFSSQTADESARASGKIESLLRKLFSGMPEHTATLIVRKGAHFMEFALLGFFASLHVAVKNLKRIPIALAFCLAAAAADEFHQLFSMGRAGMWQDVLLDFCGAAFGTALAALAVRYIIMKKDQ